MLRCHLSVLSAFVYCTHINVFPETDKGAGYLKKMHCNTVMAKFLDAPRGETEKVGYLKMHCNDVSTQFLDAPRR